MALALWKCAVPLQASLAVSMVTLQPVCQGSHSPLSSGVIWGNHHGSLSIQRGHLKCLLYKSTVKSRQSLDKVSNRIYLRENDEWMLPVIVLGCATPLLWLLCSYSVLSPTVPTSSRALSSLIKWIPTGLTYPSQIKVLLLFNFVSFPSLFILS